MHRQRGDGSGQKVFTEGVYIPHCHGITLDEVSRDEHTIFTEDEVSRDEHTIFTEDEVFQDEHTCITEDKDINSYFPMRTYEQLIEV